MKEREILRERLGKNHLSFVWLINQLAERGVVVEKGEMSSIFAGTRQGKKVDTVISLSNEILDSYEKNFAKA